MIGTLKTLRNGLWLAPDDGSRDAHLHESMLKAAGLRRARPGDRFEFEATAIGKNLIVTKIVRRLGREPSPPAAA